jgi:hypothetical protein
MQYPDRHDDPWETNDESSFAYEEFTGEVENLLKRAAKAFDGPICARARCLFALVRTARNAGRLP